MDNNTPNLEKDMHRIRRKDREAAAKKRQEAASAYWQMVYGYTPNPEKMPESEKNIAET